MVSKFLGADGPYVIAPPREIICGAVAAKLGLAVMVCTAHCPPGGCDISSSPVRDHTGWIAVVFEIKYLSPFAGKGWT